jgi:hypothetical protein
VSGAGPSRVPRPASGRRVRRRTRCRRPLSGWALAADSRPGRRCRADGRGRRGLGRCSQRKLGLRHRDCRRRRSTRRRRGRLDRFRGLRRLGDCRSRRDVGRRSLGLGGSGRRGRRDVGRGRDTGQDGRRGLRRRPSDRGSRRQERERIDIALVLASDPQAEVDVRLGEIDHAARPDGADDGALGHVRPARDADRPEVHERRGVPERGLDRDGLPAGRHRAGECHDSLGRREHVGSARSAEVNAAVLPGRVRVRTVEGEGTEHRPVDAPGPGLRGRCGQNERTERDDSDSPDHEASLLPGLRTDRPYQGRAAVVNTGYKVRR